MNQPFYSASFHKLPANFYRRDAVLKPQ